MNKRERFLTEIQENILAPYEADSEGEEGDGKFRNQVEEKHFHYFVDNSQPEHTILDLACGDGRQTLRLAERVGKVIGIDFSRNNLEKAKKKCMVRNDVAFTKGSMFQLPYALKTFDGIWFAEAFEYVPPDKRIGLLSSLNDVLKDSGILHMSVETWQSPSVITSLKQLWTRFRLYCYWKFIKRKPLLWGEFIYYEPFIETLGLDAWHYHVHTSTRTLRT